MRYIFLLVKERNRIRIYYNNQYSLTLCPQIKNNKI